MNQELSKKSFKRPTKVLAWETLLFLLTLALGILNGYRLHQVLDLKPIQPQINLPTLIIYFVVGTLILVGLSSSKFKKTRGVIFKVLFLIAVGMGGLLLLQQWIPAPWALLAVIILVAGWWKIHSVALHDLLVVLGIAGAGSLLGLSFPPYLVVLLLIAFSVYDFIAVYKTKHMVKMAKAMVEAGSVVGLIVPSRVKDFKMNVDRVSPGGKFLIVGGGDVVFPLVLCVSLVPSGVINSLIVALFSLLGLGLSFWVFASQKIKKPIPALPPISVGAIMGYLVVILL